MTSQFADSRMELVDRVVSRFVDREAFRVELAARTYLAQETLVDEKEFNEALAARRFDLRRVETALDDTLANAMEKAKARGLGGIDRKVAVDAAHEVIEMRWKCMFPFILC